MTTAVELAEKMKLEIIEDVERGIVPPTVACYADLHDFVDANCYGGTEVLLDELDAAAPDTDEGHQDAVMQLWAVANPALEIVDAWIKTGAVLKIAPKENQPVMQIAGGGIDRARKDYDAVLSKAHRCIQQNNLPAAHDFLYEAEQIAFEAGLFDEAATCRTAQEQLRKGQIPTLLTPTRESD